MKVYATSPLNPVTIAVVVLEVAVNPPGLDVTVYPVMAEPPLATGADQDTTTWTFPATPLTPVGAPGTV